MVDEAQLGRQFVGWLVAATMFIAGCDRVFGLDGRTPPPVADAPLPDGLPPLVTPPPGPTTCAPMPAFEDWTYVRAALATEVSDISPYVDHRGSRLIAVDAVTHNLLDLDATTGLGESVLAPTSAATILAPSATRDGEAIWFQQDVASQGEFVATRASGWVKLRELFGLVDPLNIELGSPGYHNGTLRMVVVLQETQADTPVLVELSSPDGRTWTRLTTVELDLNGVGYVAGPTLSADGCYLVFHNIVAVPGSLFAVARDTSGRFTGAPTRLVKAAAAGSYPDKPALSPDTRRLWFYAGVPVGTAVERRLFIGE